MSITAFRARSGFRSRTEGMNRRKPVWACANCNFWLTHKPARHESCQECHACGWHYFPSSAEATRYAQLLLEQRAGLIGQIELQPNYPIEIRGIHVRDYRADFRYRRADGKTVIEDVKPKGYRDPLYLLKRDLVQALYGIEIREVEM